MKKTWKKSCSFDTCCSSICICCRVRRFRRRQGSTRQCPDVRRKTGRWDRYRLRRAQRHTNLAQGADITSLDPHQGKETTAVQVTKHIFDTLTVVNPETGVLEPSLAESWEQTSDTSYRFKLRQDVKFHDGSQMTAEDVKFSLDRAIKSAAVSYIVDFIDTVNAVDEYTVDITLDAPYAPALRNLSVPFAAIVPKKAVEQDEEGFKLHPIGSGPYKFVDWKQGDSARLEAFDEYWGTPAVTRNLVMRVIPEASQRTIALETGEVDLAYDILPNDIAKINDNPKLALFEAHHCLVTISP